MVALDKIGWRQRVDASCSARSLEQEEERMNNLFLVEILRKDESSMGEWKMIHHFYRMNAKTVKKCVNLIVQ